MNTSQSSNSPASEPSPSSLLRPLPSTNTRPKLTELRRRFGDLSLLAINAVAAVVFTGLGGSLVYRNTQHLTEIRKWLEQSHAVLTKIQVESRRLDRIVHDLETYQIAG